MTSDTNFVANFRMLGILADNKGKTYLQPQAEMGLGLRSCCGREKLGYIVWLCAGDCQARVRALEFRVTSGMMEPFPVSSVLVKKTVGRFVSKFRGQTGLYRNTTDFLLLQFSTTACITIWINQADRGC